jgi:hypothetical protein
MKIRAIEMDDAEKIARIHADALPWSINGRLGRSHLITMYTKLLDGPDCVGHVALHKEEVIAFQISTTDWRSARRRLANIAIWNKILVVRTCLLHPYDLIALFEAVFLVPRVFRRSGVNAEIVSWASQPNNPIAAVGAHRCLLLSIAELGRRGEARCLGQMQKPNERPMSYLNRLSPSVIARFIRNDVLVFDCIEAIKDAPMISSF